MKVRILGCSGGIGGRHLRTTSLLVDNDILIDAGTGVGDLAIAELAQIDHVFITHSHLDHLACLPFMVDTVGDMRNRPVMVHATEATLEIIRAHVFNWAIWPDFSVIPSAEKPFMRFSPIRVGEAIDLDGRKVVPLPANHTVPALGYQLSCAGGSIIYSGDTWPNEAFWRTVNGVHDLRYLIIETAFSNKEQDLARTAKHLYPVQLGQELEKMRVEPKVLITHLKPSDRALIEQEIGAWAGRFRPVILSSGVVVEV